MHKLRNDTSEDADKTQKSKKDGVVLFQKSKQMNGKSVVEAAGKSHSDGNPGDAGGSKGSTNGHKPPEVQDDVSVASAKNVSIDLAFSEKTQHVYLTQKPRSIPESEPIAELDKEVQWLT